MLDCDFAHFSRTIRLCLFSRSYMQPHIHVDCRTYRRRCPCISCANVFCLKFEMNWKQPRRINCLQHIMRPYTGSMFRLLLLLIDSSNVTFPSGREPCGIVSMASHYYMKNKKEWECPLLRATLTHRGTLKSDTHPRLEL